MWNLVSSKDQRSYKILEILYNSTEPITIGTLASKTNSSIRTIKYELDDLRKILVDYQVEITSSPEGISLQLPAYMGLDLFQQAIFSSSPAFELLEIIFSNKKLSNKEMEDLLFISSSSLNRLVNILKEEIKCFGITLLSNPLQIVGEEKLIRYFFTVYFRERYDIHDWPFETVNQDLLSEILKQGMAYYEVSDNSIDFFHYQTLLAVGISRAMNGYQMEGVYEKNDNIQERQFHSFFSRIKDVSIKKNILQDELMIYFYEMVSWKYYFNLYSPEHLSEKPSESEKDAYEIKQLIDKLSYLFVLPSASHSYLEYQVNSALEFYALFSKEQKCKRYILFEPRNYCIVTEFEKNYPLFYKTAREGFIEMCKKRKITINSEIILDLIFLLLSNWKDLTSMLFYKFSPSKFLLYSHFSLQHAFSIADELKATTGKSLHVEVYKEPVISKELLANYEYDILGTTNTLTIDIDQPIFYLHRTNTKINTHILEKLLDEQIRNKKRIFNEGVKKRAKKLQIDLSIP